MIENYSPNKKYESFKITNIEGLQSGDYANHLNQINSNMNSLNANINNLNDKYQSNKGSINSYEDNRVFNNLKQSTLSDARKEDAETYMVQENYLYILGTITFAIVFVGALVIVKN